MMQTNKEKAMKIDAMIKSLHAYKQPEIARVAARAS